MNIANRRTHSDMDAAKRYTLLEQVSELGV